MVTMENHKCTGASHKACLAIFDQFLSPSPATLCHTSGNPIHKVHYTFKLEYPNDCPASICTPELCMERSIKLQLSCIVKH